VAGEDLGMSARRLLSFVIACLIFVPLASACQHDEIGVKYINETSGRVIVYVETSIGITSFELEPHETEGESMFRKSWRPYIKVVADDGRVLLEDNITIEDLEELNYRIVITDPARP